MGSVAKAEIAQKQPLSRAFLGAEEEDVKKDGIANTAFEIVGEDWKIEIETHQASQTDLGELGHIFASQAEIVRLQKVGTCKSEYVL